jgi:hypothetical protein
MALKTHSKGRGRPPKFGRPSEVVALTLPQDVVLALERFHPDIGRAIVNVVEEKLGSPQRVSGDTEPAMLARISSRHSLISVDSSLLQALPDIQAVPHQGNRAFLALEPGQGLADLELAVIDRLEDPSVGESELRALSRFRSCLRSWRRDPELTFQIRSIIVVHQKSFLRGRR